ncbi:hypothetical protein F3B47_13175 [Bacteroides fragilis]|uniref:Uncharacterized protein n=1 Tax=Bacteroides uniformis TaxID=820 RepID=A0A6I0JET1_BACUN|nr:hypothetical protein F3B36_12900 [Bacteroides fragilis]KAB4113752.1 hypothetical protein GAQ75_24315 [Bacteroides uniformis]KAA4758190.1 hypothetical protein F3B24_20280 [Bacteroides fragilis]KAA4759715.1 hypothetical protein F3B47_13175 [Bacteroides fragilis]KAA4760335.1 hypothetical protein F3B25_19095 [Bacteroides fragilis]
MSPSMRAYEHRHANPDKGVVLFHKRLNHNTLHTKRCNATQQVLTKDETISPPSVKQINLI